MKDPISPKPPFLLYRLGSLDTSFINISKRFKQYKINQNHLLETFINYLSKNLYNNILRGQK